jgi:hypothetical protein
MTDLYTPSGEPEDNSLAVSAFIRNEFNLIKDAVNALEALVNNVTLTPGPPGANGTKSITLTAFKWSNTGVGSFAQAFSFDWTTKVVSNYPFGWSASAPSAPGSGYTLYMLQLVLTDVASVPSSSGNWSGAASSSVGYKVDGNAGANGTKSITLTAFKWSNSGAGTFSGTFGYTWASGNVSNYPSGWSAAAPGSPGSGYILYMLQLVLTATATDTVTAGDWALASTNSIGYRTDGSIGPQGQGQVKGISFIRSATSPSTPAVSGSFVSPVAAGWSDGIPAGSDPLYSTTRIFTSDGLSPQQAAWTTPTLFALDGVDGTNGANGQGAKLRHIFSSAASAPALPAPNATTGWNTSPDSTTVWWSFQTNTTDHTGTIISYGGWEAAVKIKGETGNIGQTGQSARRAYVVTTLATPPAIVAGSGDVVPSNSPAGQVVGKGWSFNAYSTLASGEFQYVTDGIYTPGGNIAWGDAYLNYLKVGSLSALSAYLGNVELDTLGNIHTTGKSFGSSGSGIMLGYSGGNYVLDVGNALKYLRWNGVDLQVGGDIISTGNLKTETVVITRVGATLLGTSGTVGSGVGFDSEVITLPAVTSSQDRGYIQIEGLIEATIKPSTNYFFSASAKITINGSYITVLTKTFYVPSSTGYDGTSLGHTYCIYLSVAYLNSLIAFYGGSILDAISIKIGLASVTTGTFNLRVIPRAQEFKR